MSLAIEQPPLTTQDTADDLQVAKGSVRHVLWVNEHAAFVGGAEQYIWNTVSALRKRGVRNSLLYSVQGEISPEFTQIFEHAHPLVRPKEQIASLQPNLVFAHRVDGTENVDALTASQLPAIRFFHDHKLFCLREHKYTAITHSTCTQTTGLNCYTCLGFLGRSDAWPGIEFRTLGGLQREQKANRQFDAYVAGSEYMASHLAQHGFARERIFTLPLYAADPGRRVGRTPQTPTFLFAGALVRGKGVDTLLEAVSRMKGDCRIQIAGSGRQASQMHALADRLGVADRVKFLGRLDPQQLGEMLRIVTCAVAPSRAPETFGLSGLEAMSYGVPVIATDVGGVRSWLEDERNGLIVPPGNASALAVAMDRIVADPELASRLGSEARRVFLERFTMDRHLEQLLDLFEQIVSKHSDHPLANALG